MTYPIYKTADAKKVTELEDQPGDLYSTLSDAYWGPRDPNQVTRYSHVSDEDFMTYEENLSSEDDDPVEWMLEAVKRNHPYIWVLKQQIVPVWWVHFSSAQYWEIKHLFQMWENEQYEEMEQEHLAQWNPSWTGTEEQVLQAVIKEAMERYYEENPLEEAVQAYEGIEVMDRHRHLLGRNLTDSEKAAIESDIQERDYMKKFLEITKDIEWNNEEGTTNA